MSSAGATHDELGRALDALRHAGAERSVPLVEREALLAALAGLAHALDTHILASEAPDGLLADIRRDEPRLDHAVGGLIDDHVEFAARIAALRERAALGEPLDALRTEVRTLEVDLGSHLERTIGLVYDAYGTDPTGGDA